MELLLGCGDRKKKILRPRGTDWDGLFTVDINPVHNPDLVHDLNIIPWPVPTENFYECHAYETVEHLGRQGDYVAFFDFFSEVYRVLRPGGFFCASVPHWKSLWAWGDPGHTRIINEGSLVFLSQRQYREQVGKTPMTDYRFCYSGDFEVVSQRTQAENFYFVLEAVK